MNIGKCFQCTLAILLLITISITNAQNLEIGAPVSINPLTGYNNHPTLKTDGHGTWLAAWDYAPAPRDPSHPVTRIMFARSVDNGQSWSAPAYLNPGGQGELPHNYKIKFATDRNGRWVAMWKSNDSQLDQMHILLARSVDNGVSWSAPVLLESNADANSSPLIGAEGQGVWIGAWATGNLGVKFNSVIARRSTDDGLSWSAPQDVSQLTTPTMGVTYVGNPSLAADASGNLMVVWDRKSSPGTPVMYIDFRIQGSFSSDGGVTWNPPADIAMAKWGWAAAEPQVTCDVTGEWLAIWNSAYYPEPPTLYHPRQNLMVKSHDQGTSWSTPSILYSDPLSYHQGDPPPVYTLTLSPQMVTDQNKVWLISWQSDQGGLAIRYSINGGNTWLESAANIYSGEYDFSTDGRGCWLGIWSYTYQVNSGAQKDWFNDIMVSAVKIDSVPVVLSSFAVD